MMEELMKEAREHAHEHGHHHHHDHDGECCCGHDHDHDHGEGECCGHGHHHDHEEGECCGHDHHHDHHDHDHGENCTCGCHDHDHHHHHADDVFTSWGRENVIGVSRERLEQILKDLAYSGKYGEVLRAKGMLPAADGTWMHFDLVPEQVEIREGSADYTGKVCVIGANLDEKALEEAFSAPGRGKRREQPSGRQIYGPWLLKNRRTTDGRGAYAAFSDQWFSGSRKD